MINAIVFFLVLITSSSISSSNLELKIAYYNSLIPLGTELRQRVLTTICCSDYDALPKVENAGKIINKSDSSSYQLMHNGIKIHKDCYYGSWMSVIIELSKGYHEPQEEKVFHEILPYIPQNAVMLELGSYWGYYSMWFNQKIPGAQNYLIEPDPKNLIIGQKNFQLNRMLGHFTQATLGEFTQDAQEFIDWDYNKHIVKQISIDDFARENNIPFIHMLHSDIQGAEVDMLKGCKKLIAENRIGYFFISTHRGTHESCLEILRGYDLEILLSITREESFSADGLIVAKQPGIKGPDILETSRRTQQFCQLINEITQ